MDDAAAIQGLRNFRPFHLDWLGDVGQTMRDELSANEAAWLADQRRQNSIPAQRHTESIFLRQAARRSSSGCITNDIQESEETRFAQDFPATMGVLHRLAADLDGQLGRALLVRLAAGTEVAPHIDEGAYYAIRDRYHYVLQSECGSILT